MRREGSTLEGARLFCPKTYARKINKMPEFYIIIAPKIFFSPFFGGGVAMRLLRLWKGGDKSPAWSSQNLGSTGSICPIAMYQLDLTVFV